ncbi:uncharacterized protein K489DRAFT_171963 [Dissoconium aciculare CBS 342.82]|uniref:Uncharacterized protein n=1 Tax=Dissoconium aciculare CBS 342.82 TaxID=1314786 RepID=A0A6J3M7R2_9PEZI|nr:uncharacterized protein K489DRAFT_171963 [Dissoconium aciculare CBS 342.82]KAF1824040.1 hypothetical protein K489DRAFT_171963 [Dissoconium aciculare CBS 342.82]
MSPSNPRETRSLERRVRCVRRSTPARSSWPGSLSTDEDVEAARRDLVEGKKKRLHLPRFSTIGAPPPAMIFNQTMRDRPGANTRLRRTSAFRAANQRDSSGSGNRSHHSLSTSFSRLRPASASRSDLDFDEGQGQGRRSRLRIAETPMRGHRRSTARAASTLFQRKRPFCSQRSLVGEGEIRKQGSTLSHSLSSRKSSPVRSR